jgi:hypothetical protein
VTEIEKARAQAFVDAVDVVHKYFQMELERLQTNEDDEIVDMVQCNRILRYNKQISSALKRKAQEVKQ